MSTAGVTSGLFAESLKKRFLTPPKKGKRSSNLQNLSSLIAQKLVFFPESAFHSSVRISHCAPTIYFAVLVFSNIFLTRLMSQGPLTVFFTVLDIPNVLYATWQSERPFSVRFTFFEVTHVFQAIWTS